MADIENLKISFEKCVGDVLPAQPNFLEVILSQVVLEELAAHEKIYDQRRYDILYNGLHQLFGWSRVQLHQNILEMKSLLKSTAAPSRSMREILPQEAKNILLELVDAAILSGCEDADFKCYFKERVAILGVRS